MAGNFAGLQALVSKAVPEELGDRPEETLAKTDTPVQTAPLIIIHPSRFQKYPPLPGDVQKLRQSIASVGILEPLLVRPHPEKDGELELLAGHTRSQAATAEGLTEAPVKVFDVSDTVAVEIVTATNLQRKILDPIAETDAILELLAVKLGKSREEVKQLFYSMGNKNNVVLAEWQTVEAVLATTTRISAETFRVQRLPLLNLPDPILNAVRRGQIEYTKARAIAQIKDGEQRAKIFLRAIAESWSLAQIRQEIKELKGEVKPKEDTASRASAIARSIKRAKLDPEKQAQVDEYLSKIQALIGG